MRNVKQTSCRKQSPVPKQEVQKCIVVDRSRILYQFDCQITRVWKFLALHNSVSRKLKELGVQRQTVMLIQTNENQLPGAGSESFRIWHVGVIFSNVRDRVFLSKGWHDFGGSNGLRRGDMLRFHFHSPIAWSVRILKTTGSPTQVLVPQQLPSTSSARMVLDDSVPATVKKESSFEPSTSSARMVLDESVPATVKKETSFEPSALLPVSRAERQLNPNQKQNPSIQQPTTPSIFHLLIKPKHLLDPYTLEIPSGFVNKMPHRNRTVVLKCMNQKTWKVDWIYSQKGPCVLQGWECLRTDGYVNVGDLLVAELLEGPELTLQLCIYKEGCGRPF